MRQTKRILCVGTHSLPSNAYRRTLAFERLGYSVHRFNTSSIIGFFRRERLRHLALRIARPIFHWLLNRGITAAVTEFQPDLVFCEKSTWLSPSDIQRLRQIGPNRMRIVHYNPDDPFGYYGSRWWKQFIEAIPAYDLHFVPKEINVAEYQKMGATRVYAFDRSYDSALHQPMVLTEAERKKYGCDVGFIGSYAVRREKVIAELIRAGIQIAVWGNGWHRGANWETIRPSWRGAGQYGEDYVKAICGMKIALHFLRHENRDRQDSRTFEIPACGTFMLAERSDDHERLFEEGKEAVFFDDDLGALIELLEYYLANENERLMIATGGRDRCLKSGYDHQSRLQEFMDTIEAEEM